MYVSVCVSVSLCVSLSATKMSTKICYLVKYFKIFSWLFFFSKKKVMPLFHCSIVHSRPRPHLTLEIFLKKFFFFNFSIFNLGYTRLKKYLNFMSYVRKILNFFFSNFQFYKFLHTQPLQHSVIHRSSLRTRMSSSLVFFQIFKFQFRI